MPWKSSTALELDSAPMVKSTASLALVFYVGAVLSQTVCAFHSVHAESRSETSMGHLAPWTTPAAAEEGPSQHGDHSDTPGPSHADVCAMAVCGVAVVATVDRPVALVMPVLTAPVAYLDGIVPPEAETATPPPRLG